MSKTGFYKGRLGIGLTSTMGMGDGNPRFPLDINGDIRLTGDIMNENGFSLLGSTANGTFIISENNDVVLSNVNANVGIGTTSPATKLEVNGNTLVQGTIQATSTVTAPTFNGALSGNATTSTTAGTVTTAAQPTITSLGTLSNLSVASAGSALLPAYTSWIGDTNNTKRAWGTGYMYWTTDTAAWELTLKNGNVGIGTTTPDTLLHIQKSDTGYAHNTDALIVLERNDGDNNWINFVTKDGEEAGLLFASSTTNGHGGVTYRNTDGMTFRTGGNNVRMAIDETGNVGIGTTSPQSQLQIGDFTGTPHLTLAGKNSSATSSGIYFTDNDAGENPINYGMGIQFDSLNNILNIIGDDNGDGTTDKLMTIIRATGNVGIGTTSPANPLEVELGQSKRVHLHTSVSGGGSAGLEVGDTYNHASTPMYYITPDNGICSTGTRNNKDLDIRTNWSSRIYIKNTGNVGIGTTSPQRKLHIKGGTGINGDIRLGMDYGPGGGWGAYTDLNSIEFYAPDNGTPNTGKVAYRLTHQVYEANGNSLLVMKATEANGNTESNLMTWKHGNVGIGTTSPNYKLEVEMSGGNGGLRVKNTTNSAEAVIWTEPDYASYLYFGANNANKWSISSRASGEGYDLKFYRFNPGALEVMTMDYATGNVGIGTTSPGSKLTVDGNVGCGDWSSDGNTSMFCVGADTNWGMKFVHSGSQYYTRFGIHGSGGNNNRGFDFYDYQPAGGSRMFINGAGNVGIGTTSPGYKLEIKQGKVYLNNSNTWTDTAAANTKIYLGDTNFGVGSGHFTGDGAGEFTTLWSYNGAGRGIRFCSTALGTNKFSDYTTHMIIEGDTGNVGIGTTSPGSQCKLQVYETGTEQAWKGRGVFGNETCAFVCGVYHNKIQIGGHNGALNAWYDIAINPGGGNVGIGTTSPIYPLDVATSAMPYTVKGIGNKYFADWGTWSLGQYDWDNNYHATYIFSARFAAGIAVLGNYLVLASDRRIKQNIVDVPDNLSLETLRSIPVRYYEYIDKLERGSNKTIGFIAQEVKELLPEAVVFTSKIIPDETREMQNISWEEIIDGSNNTYKLTTDLNNCSGIKYRFYVSNDISGNDEVMKEVVGNSDNTFTFDEQWNNVFCYGKEVDDFHTLDKQKLFALNFSATQELDRKVIALESENAELKTKNTELENKVATLESELAAIKQHLGI